MRRIFAYFLMALLMCGCTNGCTEDPSKGSSHTVIVYMAGQNDLSRYAYDNLDVMLQEGYIPDYKEKNKNLLVFFHTPSDDPVLKRYFKKDGELYEQLIASYGSDFQSATPSALKQVLSEAAQKYASDCNTLLLWSHSTGWLPPSYYASPKDRTSSSYWSLSAEDAIDPYAHMVRSFGRDSGKNEIDIKDLADALPIHYDLIIFDSCLMGNVESAYELSDKCDYILASPTEVLAQGLQYDVVMRHLFDNPPSEGTAGVQAIAQAYFDYYLNEAPEHYGDKQYQSATTAIYDCAALKSLAYTCRAIFSANREKMAEVNRLSIQQYGRRHSLVDHDWYFDIRHYISSFASEQELAALDSELEKAIIFKKATNKFLNIEIKNYSGMGMYIPDSSYTHLNTYYKTLAWNRDALLIP